MRKTLLLLVSAVVLTTAALSAVGSANPNQEALQSGLQSMREGNKTEAWNQLFPLAQRGDVSAMYYLGDMFVRSPEYPDHLDRARQFLSAAAQRGHAGAEALLQQIQGVIARKAQAQLPSIAGASGMPTPEDRAVLNAAYEKYKNEVLRYTDALPESVDETRHQLSLFIRNSDKGLSELQREITQFTERYKEKVTSNIYVILEPSSWKPGQNQLQGLPFLEGGVTPDWGGQIAARHGAQQTPAFSITAPSGSSEITYDLDDAKKKVLSFLQGE